MMEDSEVRTDQREEGLVFSPDFKKRNGLLPCIVQDEETKEILMLAYVNAQAIEVTLKTETATFYSTSRQKLWTKGEESGNRLRVVNIFVDCDQDSFIYQVERLGGGACHTKDSNGNHRVSCFYRRLLPSGLVYRS